MTDALSTDSASLVALPPVLHQGLRAVTVLGLLSFFASITLLCLITYRLVQWKRKGLEGRTNQFVVLIFNLLLADIQQSLAFLLNAQWLKEDGIVVGTSTCWAQGWFVSTGDLASGVWCLTIGVHTFCSVILNSRLSNKGLYCVVGLLWAFVYIMAVIGIGSHPHDIYVRAGAWCWVNAKYNAIRLWTHYFWIFVAEFGVVIIYGVMYGIIIHRIRSNYFSTEEAARAKQIASLMVVYPLVYVVCTLPLASARMLSMTGTAPSLVHLCIAGAMITSNGWLDVLVYAMTRRIMVFAEGPETPSQEGFSTFIIPFWDQSKRRFGTTTTIEAASTAHKGSKSLAASSSQRGLVRMGSMDELVGMGGVKTETTVQIRSDPMELEDFVEMEAMTRPQRPVTPQERYSFDSTTQKFPGNVEILR